MIQNQESRSIQEKDGANEFESSTRPISAVTTATNRATNVLDHDSKFDSTGISENTTYRQDNGEDTPRLTENEPAECASGLDSSIIVCQNSTSLHGEEIHSLNPDDTSEVKQSVGNVSIGIELAKTELELDSVAVPRSSSPITENICRDSIEAFEDLSDEFRGYLRIDNKISENNATVDSFTDAEFETVKFPEVPQSDPSCAYQSSIDGRSISNASSSMSRSYMYSSASVDIPNFLEDDGDHLIPRYKVSFHTNE
jgi:hypothetical protein